MRLAPLALLAALTPLLSSTARAQPGAAEEGLPPPPGRPRTGAGVLVAASSDRGGLLSLPRGPEAFLPLEAILPEARRLGLSRALAPTLWPEGAAPRSGSSCVFVQGLNTPRPDGDELGADARVREYLARGYLEAPVTALHNGTALEGPAREAGPLGSALALLPLDQRDMAHSLLMRLAGVGAGGLGSPVTREVDSVRKLVVAALDRQPPEDLHLVGYSDGSLLVERGLALAARDLGKTRTPEELEKLLRAHVFVEYWGNATNLLVAGPKRLLVHDRRDVITTRPLPAGAPGGLATVGTARERDVPGAMAADTVIVTFESPYTDSNNHNSLAALGPALDAIKRREGVRSSRGHLDALAARCVPARHYPPSELGVDHAAYVRFLWGGHGGRRAGLVTSLERRER